MMDMIFSVHTLRRYRKVHMKLKFKFKFPRWAGLAGTSMVILAALSNAIALAQHSVSTLLGIPGVHVPSDVNRDLAVAGAIITLFSDALGHVPAQQTNVVQKNTTTGQTIVTHSVTSEVDADATAQGGKS